MAATLQQKGALHLPRVSLGDPKPLLRLAGQTMWLLGTVALLCGYLFRAATGRHVGRREMQVSLGTGRPAPSVATVSVAT